MISKNIYLSKYNKTLITFIVLLILFFDVRLFFLAISGSAGLANLGYLIFGVLFLITSFYEIFTKKFPTVVWYLFIAMATNFLVRIFKGESFESLSLFIIPLFSPFLIFTTIIRVFSEIDTFIKLLFFSVIIHLSFSIYSLFNPTFISNYTAYGDNFFIGTRAVGLFPAPGLLSFFSGITFSFGLSSFLHKRVKFFSLLLILTSLSLGLMSGNRSFLLAGIICLLLNVMALIFTLDLIDIVKKGVLLFTFILVLVVFYNYILGSNFQFILERFNEETLTEDFSQRFSGEVGILPGLKTLLENPLLGNTMWDTFSGQFVLVSGAEKITVNNGYIWILTSYGIPMGLLFLIQILRSLRIYFFSSHLWRGKYAERSIFGISLCTAMVICMSDAFLMSPLFLMLLIFPFSFKININGTI